MPQFRKTTKKNGRSGHYHIVLLPDPQQDPMTGQVFGEASTSLVEKHRHDVVWGQADPGEPATEAYVDEFGIVQAGSAGREPREAGWVVLPANDGHTHELEEYVPVEKKKKEQEEDIVSEVLALTQSWKQLDSENIENAEKADDFYWGEQWDDADRQKLEGLKRACLTLNRIVKHIDEITGHQRRQQTDIHYLPQEGGDQKVCDLLNIFTKWLLDRSKWGREKAKAFEDTVIVGRGAYNLYVDFSKDIRGEVKVEKFPYQDVIYGPHEKEDLSDCEGLTKHKFYSKAKIKQLWPEKADEIETSFQAYEEAAGGKSVDPGPGKYYSIGINTYPVSIGNLPLIDLAKKDIRVLECWRKVYSRVSVFAVPQYDLYYNAEGWAKKDIDQVKTLEGVSVFERLDVKLRITTVAGGVLLNDDDPADLPVDDFYIIPIYAKKRGDKWKGKVLDAVDAQREVNKWHSLMIDIANKMAAYGWFYDATTFPDDREKHQFLKNSSSPGFGIQVTDLSRLPQKVEGVKFPSELVQIMQMDDAAIAELLNVSVQPNGANESGAHFMQQQRMKLIGNEFLFDNLREADRKLGELLVPTIQRYYGPERIARVVMNQARQDQAMMVGGQPIEDFTEQDIINLLSTADLSQYDVIVSESSYSPSARLSIFIMLKEMVQGGVPIPPKVLLSFVDMPENQRNQIFAELDMQAEQTANQEEAVRRGEIHKTLIARGIMPPAVQAELEQEAAQTAQAQTTPQNNNQPNIGPQVLAGG